MESGFSTGRSPTWTMKRALDSYWKAIWQSIFRRSKFSRTVPSGYPKRRKGRSAVRCRGRQRMAKGLSRIPFIWSSASTSRACSFARSDVRSGEACLILRRLLQLADEIELVVERLQADTQLFGRLGLVAVVAVDGLLDR